MLSSTMRRPTAGEFRPTLLVTPSARAAELARQLSENGFRAVLEIDPAADALDPTAQRTLCRIMQEGATNIIRYAPPNSSCRYRLLVGERGVQLSISSLLGGGQPKSDLSLGWGLRGVRERVSLTRGTFTAGPSHGQWVLTVDLPVSLPTTATTVWTRQSAALGAKRQSRWASAGGSSGRSGSVTQSLNSVNAEDASGGGRSSRRG